MPLDEEDTIRLLLKTNQEQEQTIADLRATIRDLRQTIANLNEPLDELKRMHCWKCWKRSVLRKYQFGHCVRKLM